MEQEVQQTLQDHPTPRECPPSRLFVLPYAQPYVLQWRHSSRRRAIQATVQQRFWWPLMAADTRKFVAVCSVCTHSKFSDRAPAGLLHPLPIPSHPYSHIAMDFDTDLPPSEGSTTILTILDRFSKAIHFVPLVTLPSALETTNLLILNVFASMVSPRTFCQTRVPS